MRVTKTIFCLSFLLAGCKTSPLKTAPTEAPVVSKSSDANLLQSEAAARAEQISDVKYELSLDISQPGEKFFGQEKIAFEVKATAHDTFLDFQNGGKIEAFVLNGEALTPIYSGHRILLPAAKLKFGANVAEIRFEQTYAHNGRGLHRFVDPEDKRVYLYTQFESFDAQHMFPCFDQPDLKATMKMTVTTPKGWEVISATRESDKTALQAKVRWSFPETPRLSTYLFSLHAGPYAKWESKAGDIPLRLFVRQSLKKYVVPSEWFTPTQQGLKFYGEYFAYPYPFKKYDQVVVPEFDAGAMENVAAVTFSERFVRRAASTYKEREARTSVILHEMAHMWFGDLVTMQWWNGLWLNESFATYMSDVAMSQVTEFKEAWIRFYRYKTEAYEEDQLLTTHAIETPVSDVQQAESNFDSITYEKGASALKQVAYYIGEENFRNGVREYFKMHAYQNTRLQDFMGALEHSSGKDLQSWSTAWLEKAGLDSVTADYACDKGKVWRFALLLKGPDGGSSPRPHRALVSLFQERDGKLVATKSQNVLYKGARTEVPELVGAECPQVVYPNAEDHDYVKVMLDAKTLKDVKAGIAKIEDTFARMMFWPNLWSMVRDVALTPQEYLKMADENLPGEMDLTIGDAILKSLPQMVTYLPQSTTAEKQTRAEIVKEIERVLWNKMNSSKTSSDWKKMLARNYAEIVESQEGRDHLVKVLNGKMKVEGLALDLDLRWDMVVRLNSLGDPRAQALLAKQKRADRSARGIENAMASEAALPTMKTKEIWLKRLVEGKDLSYTQKRAVLKSMMPPIQDNLRASLGGEYFFAKLPEIIASRELNFANQYAKSMMPATCSLESAARLEDFVDKLGNRLPAAVLKSVRNGEQEDKRCVAIRSFASTSAPAYSKIHSN